MIKKEKLMDDFLEIFFSNNKTKLYVILMVVAGFILRLMAANNLSMAADDANHAVRPVGISKTGLMVIWDQSSSAWYYIQEVFYNIIGASNFGSRFATALFGSLLIFLMFLFVRKIFKSEKAGLIAALLTAFSPFLIKMTLPEMDITVMFFVILSGLFLYRYIENFEKKELIISGILMGIGILIKVYALFFAFSYFLFLIYIFYKGKKGNSFSIKQIILYGLIIFIFCVPTLAYNYLLYKDQGHMDLIFSNFFRVNVDKARELYGWGAGWSEPGQKYTDIKGFFLGSQMHWTPYYPMISKLPGIIVELILIIREDPLIMIFGLLGLILCFIKKERRYIPFFLITLLPAFTYIGSYIPMLKHLAFVPLLFLPFAAYSLLSLYEAIRKKLPNIRIRHLAILVMAVSLLWLGSSQEGLKSHVYAKSGEGQLISYKMSSIEKDALVVVDSRIYRGFTAWMFHDRNYLEANLFPQALEESAKYGEASAITVYFVECAIDDCGWGTVNSQPEFNASMEEMVSWFANNSRLVKEIETRDKYSAHIPLIKEAPQIPAYKVYKTYMDINPTILLLAKSTHNWYLYPLGYDRKIGPIFGEYKANNAIDSLLNKFAHLIFYGGLVLAFATIMFLIYLFIIERE
ncbi:MAG: glycosyltransferase family 39 protein [Nanoarchaeota archaeon]|nr:glycosyltransferase family 39 protein [Nanoarchaeota archaeon]